MGEIYEKRRAIGSGSIATVYEGWDNHLNRPVAIKELSDRFAGDRDFVERFLEGARRMAEISPHPHVLAIHHVDQSHETPWLIMELADGGTLAEAVLAGPTQPEQALRILRQTLLGLAEVHRHGIVHRHVQPDNVFLCKKSYKLGDFGAPRGTQDPALPTLTVREPKYVSPEELRQEKVTPVADLYSLGLVFYELLLGAERFRQEVVAAVRAAGSPSDDERLWLAYHLGPAQLPPVAAVAPHVPEALSRVLERLIRKDPAARYAGAGEALAELERAFPGGENGSGPVTPPTQPLPQQTSRPRRGRKIALAAALFLLLVAGVFLLLPTRSVKVPITSEPPGAEVWFQQERVGTTPIEPLRVRLGTELTFRKEGFEEARATLAGKDQKVLHAVLAPATLPVKLTSSPPGATVLAAGKALGTTPLEHRALPGQELVFRLVGYEERSVAVPKGRSVVHVELPLSLGTDAGSLAAALERLAGGAGLEMALAVEGAPGAREVDLGVPFAFRVRSDRAAQGVLFVLSPDGAIYCLYPTAQAAVALPAQAALELPRPEERAAGFLLIGSEPAGPHVAYLLAADEALPPAPPGEAPNRWLAVYPLQAGAGGSAADFVRWVDGVRRARPEASRLTTLRFQVLPAGGGTAL